MDLIQNDDRLIRAKELKKFLGVSSDATLWRWVRAGKLPEPQYINACRVWRASDLEQPIAALLTDQAPTTPMT